MYCDIWVCISLFSNIWQQFLHAVSAMLLTKVCFFPEIVSHIFRTPGTS